MSKKGRRFQSGDEVFEAYIPGYQRPAVRLAEDDADLEFNGLDSRAVSAILDRLRKALAQAPAVSKKSSRTSAPGAA